MPGRPKYSPEEVAALVLEGRLTSNMTVTRYLLNHDYDVRDLTTELLTYLSERGSYIGSPRLMDGSIADEYRVFCESDDDWWYVKFYVSGDQIVVLVSCWWDASVH
jgi:hypothetical protein